MDHTLSVPSNKRVLNRVPTFLQAQLLVPGRKTVDCIVWDMTEKGAKVGIDRHVPLPLYFEISLVEEGIRLRCEGRWRSGEFVGVRFRLNRP